MAIEFRCECGHALEPFVSGGVVSVPKCDFCWNEAYDEGAASRDDEIASMDSDLQNMNEQCRILQEQLNNIETERAEETRTEPD